mmetsp:Transcript_86439/g.245077  ORF Transcript_86439/g.245077 Transcript_86439/m.245077 type:complete len:227 (-) Transcript_86439:475-1155(-)
MAACTIATRGWSGYSSRSLCSSRRASSSLCACNSNKHLLIAISIVCFLVSLCSKDSFEATLMRFNESKSDLPSGRSATTLLQATASTAMSTSLDPERFLSTWLYSSIASSARPRRWSTTPRCTWIAASSASSSTREASSSARFSACWSSAMQMPFASCSRASASSSLPSSMSAQARLKHISYDDSRYVSWSADNVSASCGLSPETWEARAFTNNPTSSWSLLYSFS